MSAFGGEADMAMNGPNVANSNLLAPIVGQLDQALGVDA